MSDVHNKQTRSFNMSQIKAKDTKPELIVRKFLFSNGFRYKIHDVKLAGKPDIVLPKFKTIIFVHGCFWHGHENCRYFKIPKTRTEWWRNKIEGNINRDRKIIFNLKKDGWNVFTIFECELKGAMMAKTLESVLNQLKELSSN